MTEQNKANEETAKQEQTEENQQEQEQTKAAGVEQAQTEEKTNEESGEENIENVKTISALAYLIFFLPLLTNPESKFGKFHANQALLLLLTGLAISVVGSVIPFLGWFIIIPLGVIFCLALFVKGIINAINGKTERLPLIGGYDIIK